MASTHLVGQKVIQRNLRYPKKLQFITKKHLTMQILWCIINKESSQRILFNQNIELGYLQLVECKSLSCRTIDKDGRIHADSGDTEFGMSQYVCSSSGGIIKRELYLTLPTIWYWDRRLQIISVIVARSRERCMVWTPLRGSGERSSCVDRTATACIGNDWGCREIREEDIGFAKEESGNLENFFS